MKLFLIIFDDVFITGKYIENPLKIYNLCEFIFLANAFCFKEKPEEINYDEFYN